MILVKNTEVIDDILGGCHDIFCLNSVSILTSSLPSDVGEYIFTERLKPLIPFFVIAIVMYPVASNPFRQLYSVK